MSERSRICIVTTRNLFDSPCLDKFKHIIKEDFDVVYWDHCDIEETCGAKNYYKFVGKNGVGDGPIKKAWMYLRYTLYLRSFIRKNYYDRLIIFPNQAAWMILSFLKRKYKGKYIFDIRDHCYSDIKIFGKMTASAVNNAGLCTLTSPAFQKYLPKRDDYIISHNVQPICTELIDKYREREWNSNPIVLSFIGTVRFIPQQKKVIQALGNDTRFKLRFIGRGSEQLKQFCEDNQYKNVELIGRFERSELGRFYCDTDFALNLYGSDQITLQLALSNKLYSAAIMGMPILVSPRTYMEEIVTQYGFGLAVDSDDPKCGDKIYDYYRNIDPKQIFEGCDKFMAMVNEQEIEYAEAVQSFLAE